MSDINKAGLKMYIKRKLKNTHINFPVGEFLLVQKLGEHPLSTESGATMGGTDISLGRISGALAGASHWNKNIQIEKAAKRDKLQNAATALRAQYGFGDGMQQAQLESILKGDTVLARGTGTGEAETVTKDGKRTVYLDNYKETMSREEKLLMGITLGHEAYRDGLVGSEQQQFMETTRAVIGHTEMALRMQADKRYSESMDSIIGGSAILQKDIAAYKSGDMMTMLGHVAGNYDYSKDYWLLTHGGQLVNDGQGWLKDENGKYINIDGSRTDKPIEGKTLGAKGIETGLLNLFAGTSGRSYDSFTDAQVAIAQQLMKDAGMKAINGATETDVRKLSWPSVKGGQKLNMYDFMSTAGIATPDVIFDTYYNNTVDSQLAKAWGVDLGFERNHAVPDALAGKYSDLVLKHALGVRNPTGLKNKYKFTVYDKNNKGIELFKIDKNNPFLDDVLGQHDFRGINSAIDNEGCNFMKSWPIRNYLRERSFLSPLL